MLRMLRNSAAILVTASVLATPLAAQTAATPAAPPAPAAPTAPVTPAAPTTPAAPVPAAALPKALTDLGITTATLSPAKRGGQRVQGTLPEGTAFRAALDDQGQLRLLRTEGDVPLSADLVARLLPQPVRSAPIYAEFASVSGVMLDDEGVGVFGKAADGQPVRAGFAADGTLERFGRGAPMRKGGGDDNRGGKGKHRDADRGDDRAGHRGGKDHGMGPRDGGPAGGPAGAQGAQLGDEAVRRTLTDAGYTGLGTISHDGPRTLVEAVSPEGQNVTVTLNPAGVVVRELAR